MSIRASAICGLLILLVAGCRSGGPDPYTDDTPTAGKILVLADEDCRPVIAKELEIFSAFYRKAEVTVRYLSEADLVKAMLNDSVRCVITTVDPGGDQAVYYHHRKISTPIIPIYKGGIAVIVDQGSTLERLDLAQLTSILSGEKSSGDGKGGMMALDSLQPLFAGTGSGVARLLSDSLGLQNLRGQALADVPAVVAQVSRNPRALGLIPFEWISDLDNPEMRALRAQVRIIPIARSSGDRAVLPSQSTLADGSYPLQRTVNMILTEGKSGLGTGFVSFVSNHKGQRIILKLGVAPIIVPPRNIEIVPN